MPAPIAVVVNPASAGGRTGRNWPRLVTQIAGIGVPFDVFFTAGPLQATDLTRQSLKGGATTIVAVGGDGTINEVVNGFYNDGESINPDARLAILSSGTGGDLVKSLGITNAAVALKCLAGGTERTIDLGRATYLDQTGNPATRFFANVADFGVGGETVERVDRTSKALGGFASFLFGAVMAIMSHRNQTATVKVEDEAPISTGIGGVIIANGRFFGGGMKVSPHATLDDGLLDVVILGDAGRRQLALGLLPKVYRGQHLNHPKVSWRRIQRIDLSSAERILLEMDGELVGTTDARVEVVPAAIKILLPQQT